MDIVERLRQRAKISPSDNDQCALLDSADAIETLRTEVERVQTLHTGLMTEADARNDALYAENSGLRAQVAALSGALRAMEEQVRSVLPHVDSYVKALLTTECEVARTALSDLPVSQQRKLTDEQRTALIARLGHYAQVCELSRAPSDVRRCEQLFVAHVESILNATPEPSQSETFFAKHRRPYKDDPTNTAPTVSVQADTAQDQQLKVERAIEIAKVAESGSRDAKDQP